MVTNVKVLGVLLAVQGVLQAAYAAIFVVISPVGFVLAGSDPSLSGGEAVVLGGITSAIYLAMGLVGVAVSILSIVAGVKLTKFRGRTLALVALGLNPLLGCYACYCLPTAAVLFAGGIAVLVNPVVVEAFALSDEGIEPDEIVRRLL